MLKLYGADLSSPSNKVRFVANSLGLEYEYIQVKLRDGEHRKPEFLKINPVGKIPVIDDDGFILFESGAIVKYLCVKHNSALYPKNLRKQALVDQWSDFATIHIGGAMSKVLFNRIFFQFAKVAKDERSLEDGLNFLKRFLPIVDNHLKDNPYMTGKDFSLADIVLLANLDPAEVADVDLKPYGNIVKWRDALKKKEFYTKCYQEYGEALKQMKS